MIRFGDGSKYMSMKYDAAGRLLRRTTRVPFRDIAVSGKLQQERAKVDLAALSSRFVARNGAAASAKSTAGASSASSSASSSAPATTSQGASSSASSSGVRAAALSGNAFGMTDYDYCGNVEYTNDKAVLYHSEGYVTFDKNQQPEFHYYLKDHLGNVRVVVNERDSVEQVTHYYPFGGSFGDGVGSSVQDYLYSGKELTRFNALNWYNYGARWYDPDTLRWNGVDPMAEKYTTVSPYNFCLNNPVRYIDPDGKKVYLYATTLPGTNIPFATHTFIVITDNKDNVKKYFAFGSEYDGIKGATGGRLMQRIYNQDIDVYNGNDTEHLKAKIPISTPANMKDEEFENRISEVAESFGNNESITYMFIPIKETQGNCNTSSSTILLKSGLSPKDLENLNKLIPGVVTGFDSYTRPWTKKEQEEAVLRERKVNEIKKEIGGH
ncbi:MAG: RHS repeat-associated core domain-containing protein [Prevotella sp.]|nr:RHS repeat-associated core domain-containing protein [Prevotella sp.]